MAITTNASRIRIESSAKNGTLGSQSASPELATNQIKFDTAITTNNGNLANSSTVSPEAPIFNRRHVLLRKGTATQEFNIIQSVAADDVTCTMQNDWVTAPASGDAYDVSYRLDDVATIVGCNFEADSRQWEINGKRLIVGTTGLPGFLGMSHGQILRTDEIDDVTSGFRVGDEGIFCIGVIRRGFPNLGGMLIFGDTADNQLSMDVLGGATVRMYEFVLAAARNPDGINSLDVTVSISPAADVDWALGQHYGVDSPFKVANIYVPLDGNGIEIQYGDTVAYEGGTSTVEGFTNTSGHPFAKVILANGLVYNAHTLEVQ